MREKPAVKTILVNGIELAYFEKGAGPLVICLHGFPDTAYGMEGLVDALASQGYRAVAPFLRGYYPSQLAPDGDYQLPTVARDIIALIEVLYEGSESPQAAIVGHDWGGLTAYNAANLAPHRVAALSVLSVPHMHSAPTSWKQIRNAWYILFFQLPWLPEKWVPKNNYRFIDKLYRQWSPSWQTAAQSIDDFKTMVAHPEVLTATLAYYRQMVGKPTLEAKKLLKQKTQVPSLWFLGDEDGCVAYDQVNGLDKSFTAGVELHRIAGAGHFPHCETPELVLPIIVEFLRRNYPNV